MISKRFAAASAAVALVGAGFGVATAGADTYDNHQNFAKDGNVYLFKEGGGVCKISGSVNLTPSTCLNASITRVANAGYTTGVGGKSSVRLYYNKSTENGGRSAFACISPNDQWTRGPGGVHITFNQVNSGNTAGTGLNKPIWHDIARVQWVTGC